MLTYLKVWGLLYLWFCYHPQGPTSIRTWCYWSIRLEWACIGPCSEDSWKLLARSEAWWHGATACHWTVHEEWFKDPTLWCLW